MADRILIKNGMVYDPFRHEMKKRDIALADGKICVLDGFSPNCELDASDCYVTPGLIDFHLHCFTGSSDGTCDADTFCLPNGVTTCIDAGTAGSANFRALYADVIARSVTRVLALLHIAPEGLTTGRHPENQSPEDWDREMMKKFCSRYPEIVGIKIRMGKNICEPYGLRDEHLKEGIRFAESLGKKVVVHVNDPNVPTEQIAEELRPGDVFCHMYAGKTENILAEDGTVKAGVKEARERGVLFDACNGRGNFLFQVAEPALKDGFLPDIISSDNSPYGNYKQPLISLPRLLSRYLMFGMKLEDVLDCATIRPARWIGMESLASMDAGTEADIAIFKLNKKRVQYKDCAGAEREGNEVLVPQLTIRDGVIVYAQSDFL